MPTLSPEQIAALDQIEAIATTRMMLEITGTANRLFTQAENAPADQIEAIVGFDNGLALSLQRAIAPIWNSGQLSGIEAGIIEMQRSVPQRLRPAPVVTFAITDQIKAAIAALFQFTPETFRNVLAERAVQARVIKLAGSFSDDTIKGLKADLLAAVMPQPDTGNPISRPELLDRIQKRLGVARVRAEAIARTETTTSYAHGRLKSFEGSSLVTHLLFSSISDDRRTEICTSRAGMIVPVTEKAAIAANSPSLHVRCRSTWSPLMGNGINPSHTKMIEDPNRLWSNRLLAPLPKGWNSGGKP